MIDDEKFTESLRHNLFTTDTARHYGHALCDSNGDVRNNSINFFIAAIVHGISFHFDGRIILIFVADFRDKIFVREIVAALGRALGDTNPDIRRSAAKTVTAAIDHGALHCYQGVFILKYWQRVFEIRYLTPR